MIESLLCGASAGRMTGVRLDANQELIAQGVGNILLPFFGGIPQPRQSRVPVLPSNPVQKQD